MANGGLELSEAPPGPGRSRPCYGPSALDGWAGRLARGWADVDSFVYFNNDPGGCALRDARTFAGSVRRAGLEPTRLPEEAIDVG